MAVSQNGWPVLDTSSRYLTTWNITDDGTRLRLRNGSGGFLLAHLARRFDKRVEDVDDNYRNGQLDDWAHAVRPIRGYTTISNHASGTAIDLNATEHPLGVDHTFTPEEVRIIRNLLRLYDGCIRWGGDYSGRKDAMHFELDKGIRECEVVARRLMATPNGRWLLANNKGQREAIES